jgi:hypothetical protein
VGGDGVASRAHPQRRGRPSPRHLVDHRIQQYACTCLPRVPPATHAPFPLDLCRCGVSESLPPSPSHTHTLSLSLCDVCLVYVDALLSGQAWETAETAYAALAGTRLRPDAVTAATFLLQYSHRLREADVLRWLAVYEAVTHGPVTARVCSFVAHMYSHLGRPHDVLAWFHRGCRTRGHEHRDELAYLYGTGAHDPFVCVCVCVCACMPIRVVVVVRGVRRCVYARMLA